MTYLRISSLVILSTYFSVMIAHQSLNSDQNIQWAGSGLYLGKTTIKAIKSIIPNEDQRLKEESLKILLEPFLSEENLKQCLIENAFKDREQGGFPTACNDVANFFALVAGDAARNDLKAEFNKSINELLPKPVVQTPITQESQSQMSSAEKVIIGGVVIVIAGVAAFFAAPVLIPGTVIAVKATAAATAIQTTVVAAGTKVAAAGGAVVAAIVQEAINTESDFENFSRIDKLKVTADVIKGAEQAIDESNNYYVIEVNESGKFQTKESIKPLKERIEKAHFKDKK